MPGEHLRKEGTPVPDPKMIKSAILYPPKERLIKGSPKIIEISPHPSPNGEQEGFF
jgi:hypothetical protein